MNLDMSYICFSSLGRLYQVGSSEPLKIIVIIANVLNLF